MKVLRRTFAVVAGVCAASTIGVAPAHAGSPFIGTWEATDIPDGSHMTLAVSGNAPHYGVRYVDEGATICGGSRAVGSGRGDQDGDLLFARVMLACTPGGSTFREHVEPVWEYDAGTDTLVEPSGIIWHRT
jgi:hypothetical protein